MATGAAVLNPLLVALAVLSAAGCATYDAEGRPDGAEWDGFKKRAGIMSLAVERLFRDDDYRRQVSESVASWFGKVAAGLRVNSIEQLAANADEARQIAAWSSRYEALAPYGAWLAARIDYFEAAQEAMNRIPSLPTVPPSRTKEPPPRPAPRPLTLPEPPPPAPRGTITVRGAAAPPVLPPPRPPQAPTRVPVVPPTLEHDRVNAATRPSYWKTKVASHSVPQGADGLARRLRPVFRAEQVPEALVWVAEVESTFNPSARSPAGAVGLFQLMPATARSLGLSTHNPDERLDAEANAAAAARYFRLLHNRFGSWPLVFAAYNCGEGRVSKALKRSGGREYASIAPLLPLETRMYVPRVQETLRLRAGIAPSSMP